MKDKDYLWLIALLIVISTTAFYQRTAPPEDPPTQPFRLVIDSGEVVNTQELPVEVLQGPADQQALLKVSFGEFKRVRILVHYRPDEEPGEWSLNIGDSRSNNGYSGDGGHQTHDSEIQIKGTTMSIWGSDVMVEKKGRDLERVKNFVRPGQTVEFEISDQMVKWKSPQDQGELQSHFLFALAGQAEQEGTVNRDIFIGINQVVNGGRTGWGVASVEVEMLP
jgi:hypothetical protein